MKFTVLIYLACTLTACAYVPLITLDTLEIIEDISEFEEHRYMVFKWYEEDSEEGEALRELYWNEVIGSSHCFKIRPKKWPYGMC